MMTSLIVTIIAPDRPGLVRAVSDKATEFGANWADSLMAQMAGQFAGIVHLQVPSRNADMLIAALRGLDADNIHIGVSRAMTAPHAVPMRHITLDLVGQDRPGIIKSISTELARQGVSIDKLQTQINSGAMSGEQMFHMHAQLSVPMGLDDDALRDGLESLANELMVDITLDDARDIA
jgi:glycine cleavage system regulatory protein